MLHIECLLIVVCVNYICCGPDPQVNSLNNEHFELNPAVRNLQEYIRIDSSKEENYEFVVEFWKRLASDIGIPIAVYRPAGLPVCVMTWEGSQPQLPSILLNTHSDVVPVYNKVWKYPPFAAIIDENGNLYGRGSQDTKSLAIQHYEAIRYLKQNNITLQRTIHISVMPDEEVGGFRGIKEFVKTDFFKKLNVGFALDEGLTSEKDIFYAIYQDKRPWQINMTLYGEGGHGSKIADRNVVEKLQSLLNTVMAFRKDQRQLMMTQNSVDSGVFTTVNVNIIKGGIATNIIPNEITVVIDIRLATDAKVEDMDQMLESWRAETGSSTKMEFIRRDEVSPATATDNTNPFWLAIQNAAEELNITIKPITCPATSDMLVLRKLGIPALGFAPNVNMNIRMHDNDEYIPIHTFLNGISICTSIVRKLGMV